MNLVEEMARHGLLKSKTETTSSAMVGADQAKVPDSHQMLKRRMTSFAKLKEALRMFSEAYSEIEQEINELYCPKCKPYDWSTRREKDEDSKI